MYIVLVYGMLQVTLASLPSRLELRLFWQRRHSTRIRTPRLAIIALYLNVVHFGMANLDAVLVEYLRNLAY